MTTNQVSPGPSKSAARIQGRRHSSAWTRVTRPAGRSRASAPTVIRFAMARLLAGDRRPRRLPFRIRHAFALAVATVGEWRLPELDGVEVGRRRVRVILCAGPGLQLLHLVAGLAVYRCLAEEYRLLRLDVRRADPLVPLVGAVGMGRFGPEHPGVGPAGRPLGRDGIGDWNAGRLQGVRLVRPGRPDHDVVVREQRDLLRGEVPVLLDQWP